MRQLLIACETLHDEVLLALKKTNMDMEIRWMPNKLHDQPEYLKEALQDEINRVENDYDELLFAYGNCGNGLVGIKSHQAKMVIPKYSDCISLLLSHKPELERMRTNTYFLTPGWIKGEKSLQVEYAQILKKYGEKRTKKIYQIMFKNYQNLMLIDTGAYKLENWLEQVEKIGQMIGLSVIVDDGTITPLEKLMTRDWQENFCVIPPGQATSRHDFFEPIVKKN